jgi:hypothetical protein
LYLNKLKYRNQLLSSLKRSELILFKVFLHPEILSLFNGQVLIPQQLNKVLNLLLERIIKWFQKASQLSLSKTQIYSKLRDQKIFLHHLLFPSSRVSTKKRRSLRVLAHLQRLWMVIIPWIFTSKEKAVGISWESKS